MEEQAAVIRLHSRRPVDAELVHPTHSHDGLLSPCPNGRARPRSVAMHSEDRFGRSNPILSHVSMLTPVHSAGGVTVGVTPALSTSQRSCGPTR
jgi:hypothetical protein